MAANETWSAEIEFTAGVWTDVTAKGDTAASPFTITGGDTPEASADPGGMGLPLQNSDQRFTPLNVLGPYHPIEAGIRCRITDTQPGQTPVDLFTGYLREPQIDSWAGGNADAPRDQIVFYPFVDLVSWVEDSNTLAASLTELVKYRGGSDLKGLWPLTNESGPFFGVGPVTDPITVTQSTSGSVPPLARAASRGGDAPQGAEANALRCNRVFDPSTGGESNNRVLAPTTFGPALNAGESVTAVFWFNHHELSAQLFQQIAAFTILGSSAIGVELLRDSTTGVWSLQASGAQSATITAGPVGLDALLPIGIRYCPSPANMELWIGSVRLTVTPTGSAPTGMTIAGPDFGFQAGGYDLSTVQLYTGTTWGYADYLEQIGQAHSPLDQQTTGERIRRALSYAGVTLPMHRIDPGVCVMGPVSAMAGTKASDHISTAVETEQGEYYADGSGLPVFADRQRLYNV